MASGRSAGISKGLAGVLQTRRATRVQTERDQADRDFTVNLAMMQPALDAGIESGDFSQFERVLEQLNPELVKQWKKQGGVGAVIAPLLQQAQAGETAQPGAVAEVEVPASEQYLADAQEAAGGAPASQGPPPAAAADSGVFGLRWGLDPEARRAQAREGAVDAGMVQFDVRRRAAKQLGLDPSSPEWRDFVQYGTRAPASAAATQPKLGTIEDFMMRKVDEQGSAPTANDVAIWRTEWEAMNDPEKSPLLGSFEDYVGRYAGDRSVEVADLSAEDIEEARRRYTDAGRELKEVGESVEDMAVWAASSPGLLQTLTASDAGPILAAIARNPVLKRQYDRVRMEPIRAQADTVISTLNELLEIDEDGNVTGLTEGAAGLYGLGIGRISRHLRGSQAAIAQAALDQITGQLVLSTLADMKAQSRTGATGFGQLSNRELDVIEAAATMLKGGISEELALEKLTELREKFQKVLLDREAETGADAGRAGVTGGIDLDTPLYIIDGRMSTTPPPGAP